MAQTELDQTIFELLPRQGEWSEEDYLWLTRSSNRLIELRDGVLDFLPMPTEFHLALSQILFLALLSHIRARGGVVFYAPLRLRVAARRFREPDLLALVHSDDTRRGAEYWEGADLVVEIVSPDKPERDYVEKRADYAHAGVTEYWIVDPQTSLVTVLRLDDQQYVEHGVFGSGTVVTSALLEDFEIAVDTLFGGVPH